MDKRITNKNDLFWALGFVVSMSAFSMYEKVVHGSPNVVQTESMDIMYGILSAFSIWRNL